MRAPTPCAGSAGSNQRWDVLYAAERLWGNFSSDVEDIWKYPVTWSSERAERSSVPPEMFIPVGTIVNRPDPAGAPVSTTATVHPVSQHSTISSSWPLRSIVSDLPSTPAITGGSITASVPSVIVSPAFAAWYAFVQLSYPVSPM